MPLKVYIAPFRWYKEKEQGYFYYSMVKDAFELWSKASNEKIAFEFVDNLYNSQINIDWKRVDRTSLGHCLFNFDPTGRLFSAEIQIGLSDGLLHKKYQDKKEVRHTIIHEVGHALGLNHSPYQDDIMYVPHQYGTGSVSERDAASIKWLYEFPYGATENEILSLHQLSSDYTLDHLIYFLENPELNGTKNGLLAEDKVETSEQKPAEEAMPEQKKVLHYEQDTLAEFNKYNLSLQNINISSNIQDYFKKIKIQKDLKKND